MLAGALSSCGQAHNTKKPMEKEKTFGWSVSVTAPRNYTTEVHKGYFSGTDKFISAIYNMGAQGNGWCEEGTTGAGSGNTIPSKLTLTWVSYAEKKFWKIDTLIDSVKILHLFEEGYMNTDRTGVTSRVTYKQIIIGLAPGGIVVLWLAGDNRRVEVGRYQAKETSVDVNAFVPVPGTYKDLAEFYTIHYENSIPEKTKELIKAKGIPFGVWDEYRVKYNYNFRIQFYKEDKEDYRHCTYLNGEEEIIKGENLKSFQKKALPWRVNLKFTEKWAEAEFNDEELMAAFKEFTKEDKTAEVEIVGKVGFMYNDMEFWVQCKDKKIPLKKVKIGMWNRAKPQ